MNDKFLTADQDTTYLLPPSIQEWVAEDHLARFIVDIVDHLDMEEIESAYTGRGSRAYHPKVLTALLFYGYATGIFSSRKKEKGFFLPLQSFLPSDMKFLRMIVLAKSDRNWFQSGRDWLEESMASIFVN